MLENVYSLKILMVRYARLHLLLLKNVKIQIVDVLQLKQSALVKLIFQPINLRKVLLEIRLDQAIQLQADVIGMMLLQLVTMKPALKLPQEQ